MFHKILAAIDMSKIGKRVFDEALNQAKANGASLMLLHVLCPDEEGCPDMSALYSMNPDQSGTGSEIAERYQKLWDDFADKGLKLLQSQSQNATNAGIYTKYAQNFGNPGQIICETACTWDADLIVIGRRGLSRLSEVFLGSVSNYVIHHAPCSVLTVQTQAKIIPQFQSSKSSQAKTWT